MQSLAVADGACACASGKQCCILRALQMGSLLAALWHPLLRRQATQSCGGSWAESMDWHPTSEYSLVLIPSCPPTELAAVDLALLA